MTKEDGAGGRNGGGGPSAPVAERPSPPSGTGESGQLSTSATDGDRVSDVAPLSIAEPHPSDAPARTTFLRKVYHHRGKVLFVIALVCYGLGLYGYSQLRGKYQVDWPDRFYVTLSLFRDTTTTYNGLGPPFPWPLEVARFLAPLVLVAAGLSAVMALFSAQFNRLLVRLYRNHLIICGLGEYGLRLAIKYDDMNEGRRSEEARRGHRRQSSSSRFVAMPKTIDSGAYR